MPSLSTTTTVLHPVPGLPSSWAAASAEIVEALDSPLLPARLASSLETLVAFEHCEQFVYRRHEHPICVYESFKSSREKFGLNNYLRNTYVLSPFFNTFRSGLKTGTYRHAELALQYRVHDIEIGKYQIAMDPSEVAGYVTDGWPRGREEVCIALEMPGGECTEITLARSACQGAFSTDDVALLKLVTPFLASVFRRYWRQSRFIHFGVGAHTFHHSLGAPDLTPREREVAQLVLSGHSTPAISLILEISETTVKTHRKNLYAKLGISSHFEFFALFANFLHQKGERAAADLLL